MLYRTKISKRRFDEKKSQKKLNHSLHHSSPFHLALPQITMMDLFPGLYEASWVVLGPRIYFFGALGETETTDQMYYLNRNLDGSFPAFIGVTDAGCMISARRRSKVVALDGKVYVFGGDDSNAVFAEVFELSLDSFSGQSRKLSSPTPSASSHCNVVFAVAIETKSKIVVGGGTKFLVYDAVEDSWVEHNIDFSVNLRSPLCHPMAVESCLYWLDETKMRAFDLITGQHFEGPIKDHLVQQILKTPGNLQVCLGHLGEAKFWMTWINYHNPTVLHYTMMEVRRRTTHQHSNNFSLRATVLSCESFISTVPLCLQDRALLL